MKKEYMYPDVVYVTSVSVCVYTVCSPDYRLSEDPGHLRTQSFFNKQGVKKSADVSRVKAFCRIHILA